MNPVRHQRRQQALVFITLVLLMGCQAPLLVFPGKALRGTASTADSFAFAETYQTLQLEVNPTKPYSVIVRTTVINGELYIDAAKARRWAAFLAQDPKIKIKLGDNIYPAVAEQVTDKKITDRFLSGRSIYRIEPVR